MTTRWYDLADLLEGRARRLGIDDDIADMLLVAWSVLQNFVDVYDLPSYIVTNDALFRTRPGHTAYPLPEDFGRLLKTTDQQYVNTGGTGDSGIYLATPQGSPYPLNYVEAIAFRRQSTLQANKPSHFTISGRQMLLDPPPDDNGGSDYIGQGTYMASVQRPDLNLEGEILLPEPTAIVASTLYQIAADRALPQAAALEKEHTALLSAVVNNAARHKLRYWYPRWPARWTR